MPKCDHCLIDFPEAETVRHETEDSTMAFCCNGCRGIYLLIHEEGLSGFYEKRKWDNAGVQASSQEGMTDLAAFEENVSEVDGAHETDIYLDGIRCASCVWLNEKILTRTRGVLYARVNYATHRARVRWDPSLIGLADILGRIHAIGYRPKPLEESDQARLRISEKRDLILRFGTAAFLSSQLMIYSAALYAGYFQGIDASTKFAFEVIAMLLTIPVLLYSGWPFLRATFSGLRSLHFNMDSLISIGAGSAFIYSIYAMFTGGEVYFDTTTMIITLILLGRLIEANAKGKASEAIDRLTDLAPREARIVAEDGRKSVAVVSIKEGEMVEVLPGERIPLDGIVVQGSSEADESLLTGESRPVSKTAGSRVIGGSMNLYGAFIFRVTATGRKTVLSNIISAVEDAQASRPRIQSVADRVVGYFVPAILLLALATIFFRIYAGEEMHRALMAGISVLVIACPCSLGLATPLAVLIFTAMASARGILIKGGEVVEDASRINHVVFDKTGTITLGRPHLKKTIVLDEELNADQVLKTAAALEALSEHSLSRAVTAAAGRAPRSLEVSEFRAVPGMGIEGMVSGRRIFIGNAGMMQANGVQPRDCRTAATLARPFEEQGDTVIRIGWEDELKAVMVISDLIRDDAAGSIRDIKAMGCGISMVSGDNPVTTASVAAAAGITDAIAGVSPVGKKEAISDMQSRGLRVLMVGDGINDAPALTQASVGIAMGRGTHIAMESAGAVLVRNDLSLIPYFIGLSKKTMGIIRQNIFWAFFYNVVAIPLAITGMLHPIAAAGAMAASSLFVVINSLRIRNMGRTGKALAPQPNSMQTIEAVAAGKAG